VVVSAAVVALAFGAGWTGTAEAAPNVTYGSIAKCLKAKHADFFGLPRPSRPSDREYPTWDNGASGWFVVHLSDA
jgi:hypothetical protein